MKITVKVISVILIFTLLCPTLLSCAGNQNQRGNQIGDRCIATDLELVSGRAKVNIDDYLGKIVFINFWGTWCPPCRNELPHFDEVAEEYADSLVILTVHSNYCIEDAPIYIYEYFPDSKIVFAKDSQYDEYYRALNPGESSYPITIVLDENGVIKSKTVGAMSKATLIAKINKAK